MTYSCIDLDFRPATYWPDEPTLIERLAHVKRERRRELIQAALARGECTPEAAIDLESLPGPVLRWWARLDRSKSGGDDLPDLRPGQVEIVRLSFAMTLADHESIRAISVGERIVYTLVDHCDNGRRLRDPQDARAGKGDMPAYGPGLRLGESSGPLSLGELAALLDATTLPGAPAGGLVESNWDMRLADGDAPEVAVAFVSVGSAFYPRLADLYAERAAKWLAHHWCGYLIR